MNFFTRFVRPFVSPLLWVSVIVLLLAVWIWFYGPLIAFGDSLPLQGRRARALVIASMLAGWLAWLAWRLFKRDDDKPGPIARWRERRRKRRERAAAAAGLDSPRIAELHARFRDALQRLRTGVAPTSRIAAWLDRLTGRSKYRLPWFVVAGSAGSGKTSLLTRSGLNLDGPLPAGVTAPSTEECDWWFANDAVLVDTPHDAFDAASDERPASGADTHSAHSVWTALTGLLRRYRPRQPLNGVLLTVAADKLIAMSATERTTYAEQLVRPLRAMQSKIDVRVPVYVCVTRMDRLQGFSAWFASLGPVARETPWGVGYALDDPRPGEPTWPSRNGLSELAKRLGDGLCAIFDAQPELGARAIAYLFPRQFEAVCAAIGAFCENLFRDSRFEARLQLRGIYFTAAGHAANASNAGNGPASTDFMLPARGNALAAAPDEHAGPFVKPLLRDVLFADAGFVGVSHAEKRRRRRWQIALAVIAISLLTLLVAGWIASYARNRAWLNEVDTHVAAFERDATGAVSTADPHVLLPMLDALRTLPETSRFDLDSPPLVRYGLGLYQGTRIRAAADDAYQRALREKLLPLLDARLEQQLADAPADDIEYDYAALKAYLMLHDPSHYDGSFLVAWLSIDMQRTLPASATPSDRAQMDAHLANLFANGRPVSTRPLNQTLVDAVRARIAQIALPERSYRVLRRELMRTIKAPPVTIADAGGPQAALAFVRASGKPLTDGIPPLFTYRGYWDFVDKRLAGTTATLARDDGWVLGIASAANADDATRASWTEQARRLYLNDYVAAWDDYLGDIRLVPAATLAQSTQRARVLSAPDSPLRNLLQVVAKETQLLRADAAKPQLTARWRQRMDDARHSLEAVFGRAPANGAPSGPDAPPESIVDAHFLPLRQLVGEQGSGAQSGAPLDTVMQTVNALYEYLNSASAALASGSQPPTTDVFSKLQADAGRLPMPLRGFFNELANGAVNSVGASARKALAVQTSNGIGSVCRQMTFARYPFERGAARDMLPDEFTRLFAAGGLFDDYFQKNFAAETDTSGPRWRFRPLPVANADATSFKADAPRDAAVLDVFSAAARIRDTYLGANGRTPAFDIVVTPLETDPDILQYTLTVGAQTLRYAHGPATPQVIKWTADATQPVTLEINAVNGQQTLLRGEGPWALQRLFDKAQLTQGLTADTQTATFDVTGHKLALRIGAGTGGGDALHRAELRAFRCPT